MSACKTDNIHVCLSVANRLFGGQSQSNKLLSSTHYSFYELFLLSST